MQSKTKCHFYIYYHFVFIKLYNRWRQLFSDILGMGFCITMETYGMSITKQWISLWFVSQSNCVWWLVAQPNSECGESTAMCTLWNIRQILPAVLGELFVLWDHFLYHICYCLLFLCRYTDTPGFPAVSQLHADQSISCHGASELCQGS